MVLILFFGVLLAVIVAMSAVSATGFFPSFRPAAAGGGRGCSAYLQLSTASKSIVEFACKINC